ncbi:MAG: lyase-like protein [Candidatus Eremiobacteraeota bacterium]|nr:lyase-like protein [Candidatus Eremiobacteraeota bacterium]
MNGIQRSAPLALLLLAVGCGGSGQAVPVKSPAAPPTTAALLHATFTMHWGAAQPQATRRAPKYIAATTRSIAIFVNGGSAQITNAPPVGQPQTTNIVIDAPVGTDTFTIAAYDATNGVGTILSHAVFSQQIAAGAANTLSASLNGVVKSASVSLTNATPPAGTAATSAVNVTAVDPDGNVIVGSTDYDHPVLLTNSDASGATSLSTTTVANASTAVALSYNGKALTSATVDPGNGTGATFAPIPTITEYMVPGAVANDLVGIAAGPDGNVWFTEAGSNAIGRITTAGVVSTFPIPTAGSNPVSITGAPDGALWFTQPGTGQVGRMTTQGVVTEFSFPNGQNTQGAIVATSQAVEFLERPSAANTLMGVVAYNNGGIGEWALGNSAYNGPAALGPDGNVWYIDGQLRRLVANGPIDAFAVPPVCTSPRALAAGPDGNLWYICSASNYVVRQTTAGVATAFHVPGLNVGLAGIAAGPDGALWFTEGMGAIGRITTSGTITEYPVPTTFWPYAITAGPDGNIWFTEYNSPKIGKLVY